MKKIAFLLLITFHCLNLKAHSLIPLEEYCKEHNIEKDELSLGYVALRCGSLFSYVAGLLDNTIENHRNRNSQDKYIVKKYSNDSSFLLKSSGNYLKAKPEKVSELAFSVLILYTKEGEKNYLRGGNFIKGSYIENDLNICETLIHKIK